VVQEIKDLHEKGQPVLVGTISIDVSEKISRMLAKEKIKHSSFEKKTVRRSDCVKSQSCLSSVFLEHLQTLSTKKLKDCEKYNQHSENRNKDDQRTHKILYFFSHFSRILFIFSARMVNYKNSLTTVCLSKTKFKCSDFIKQFLGIQHGLF